MRDEYRDPINRPVWRYNAETAQHWHDAILDAKARLDIEKRAARWKSDEKYNTYEYDGSTVPVNRIRRKLRAIETNIFSATPSATPQFVEQDDEERWRDVLVALAERELRQIPTRRALRAILRDAIWKGTGWIKSDFITRFGDNDPGSAFAQHAESAAHITHATEESYFLLLGQTPAISEGDAHSIHQQIHEDFKDKLLLIVQAGMVKPELLDILDAHIEEHTKAVEAVSEQGPALSRIPPGLVYYDPDALGWDDTEWYAIELVERLEVLRARKDLRYTNKIEGSPLVRIDPLHENREVPPVTHGDAEGPLRERFVRYWMIHSVVDNQLIIVAEPEVKNDKPLFVGPWPYPGRNIRPLVLEEINDRVHGVSQVDKLRELQYDSENVRYKIRDFVKRVPILKLGRGPGKHDLSNKQIANPNLYFVDGLDKDSIWPLNFGSISKEFFDYDAIVDAESNQETGVPELAHAGRTGETATASTIRSQQFGGHMRDFRGMFADLIAWWLETMIAYYRELGDTDLVVRMVGDRGSQYARFNPRLIPRGVTWIIDVDSLAPEGREVAKKRTLEMIQTLMPFIQAGLVNHVPPLRQLANQFSFENKEELLGVDPAKRQEIAAMMGGGPANGAQQTGGAGTPQQSPAMRNMPGQDQTDGQMMSNQLGE